MKIGKVIKFSEESMKVIAFLLFLAGVLFYLSPSFERQVLKVVGPHENYYIGRFFVQGYENEAGIIKTSSWGISQVSPRVSDIQRDHGYGSLIESAFQLEDSVIYNSSPSAPMIGRSGLSADAPIVRMAPVNQCLLVREVFFIPYQYFDNKSHRFSVEGKEISYTRQDFPQHDFSLEHSGSLPICFFEERNCFDSGKTSANISRMTVWARAVQVSC